MKNALLVVSALVIAMQPVPLFALGFEEPEEISNKQKAAYDISFTGGSEENKDVCTETGSPAQGGSLDGFLKALADQESSGNPKAEAAGSTASGKYQYLDDTWKSRKDIYPPSGDYAHASDAPEAVQDAVAYIEYSKKFTEYNQDIFKLALSHFYPAALTDPSKLDTLIGSNTITPREYAESMVVKVSEGVGSQIPLLYADAPEFTTYATASVTPAVVINTPGDQNKGTVFIDPGHGGTVNQYIDTVTGQMDRETNNTPETADVLKVAKRVKTKLESDGYTVKLARTTNNAKVDKRQRVNMAQGSDIAISIHTTNTPGGSVNEVWPQRMGKYREYTPASGAKKKVAFNNQAVADKSDIYAKAIAEARKTAENRPVSLDPDGTQQEASFGRDDLPTKGNIALIQLWGSDIPWVYNEYEIRGSTEAGLSQSDATEYANGLIEGIKNALKASVPTGPTPTPTTGSCGGSSFSGGDISQTTLAYAWPEYHQANYLKMMPAYKEAVTKASASGIYVGGGVNPGIDCGGFVTTLLVNSGFEPNYNYGGVIANGAGPTPSQEAWVKANWQSLGKGSSIDVASLQPGDVAFSGGPDHTFVFVGDIPGFGKTIASASYSTSGSAWRSPMAGTESLTSGDIRWYRKGA